MLTTTGIIVSNEIVGEALLELTDKDITDLIPQVGTRIVFRRRLEELREAPAEDQSYVNSTPDDSTFIAPVSSKHHQNASIK